MDPCPEVVNYAISLIHPGERLTLRNVITHTHTSVTSGTQEVCKTFTGEEGIITRKQLAHYCGSWKKRFFFSGASSGFKQTIYYENPVAKLHVICTKARVKIV